MRPNHWYFLESTGDMGTLVKALDKGHPGLSDPSSSTLIRTVQHYLHHWYGTGPEVESVSVRLDPPLSLLPWRIDLYLGKIITQLLLTNLDMEVRSIHPFPRRYQKVELGLRDSRRNSVIYDQNQAQKVDTVY